MKLERRDQVLKCIVEEFIKTAQPVGSETILKEYHLDCSSATIRNAMVLLEKDGLIEKTHVSSGRVPSSKGYQYYLEHLDNQSVTPTLDLEFQRQFQEILKNKSRSVEEVISRSCEVLSEMTNAATVVLGPKANDERLISIQLIKLSENQAMGIFITDSGYVEKKTFIIDKKMGDFQLLQNAVALLNERLSGTKISELAEKARSLKPIVINLFGKAGDLVVEAFIETLVNFARNNYQVYGQKNLLSMPEFSNDKESFLSAIETLENPHKLEKNLASKDDLGYANIGFTNENKGDFAIISKNIGKDSIAVVGPKRMDYKKVLTALEYVVYMLNRYLSGTEEKHSLIPVSEPVSVAEPNIKKIKATPKVAKRSAPKKEGGMK